MSIAAVAAGYDLVREAKLPIEIWQDDSLKPNCVPLSEVVLALSWTYLRTVNFDLQEFLQVYRPHLVHGGTILIDVVDTSFDRTPNNEYQTDDWHLPPEQRRVTQYKLRMSEDEVGRAAAGAGFDVIARLPATELPPRSVYVLRSRRQTTA